VARCRLLRPADPATFERIADEAHYIDTRGLKVESPSPATKSCTRRVDERSLLWELAPTSRRSDPLWVTN
jgi:hypothetical protein